MPPWTRGWRVFTRPPRISGAAVYSPTGTTRSPASERAFWVPPVESSSIPFAARRRAKGTSPVLSDTERRARRTAKGHLRNGGVPSSLRARGLQARRGAPALLVEVVPEARAGLVLGHGPELEQAAGLDLADALAGEVHDGPHLLERDAATVGDVERTGLPHLPDLLVREVQLDGAGGRVHVQVQVVLAGDEHAGAGPLGAIGAGAGARGLHLPDDLLHLRVDHAERPLAPELPGDLLAGHGPGAAPAALPVRARLVERPGRILGELLAGLRRSHRLRAHRLVLVHGDLAAPRLVHLHASLPLAGPFRGHRMHVTPPPRPLVTRWRRVPRLARCAATPGAPRAPHAPARSPSPCGAGAPAPSAPAPPPATRSPAARRRGGCGGPRSSRGSPPASSPPPSSA